MSDPIGTLPVMKISDMVPKEEFRRGDRVRCPGGECGIGIVLEVEADHRLAKVRWSRRVGWWYLKDLEVVRVKVMSAPITTFGVVDRDGDIVEPTAFAEGDQVAMAWSHEWKGER